MTADATTATAAPASPNGATQLSLSTAAARNLATTTKTVPQMQEISSRWLLRMLPWVDVSGGTYRVNRRLAYAVGDGRVDFVQTGAQVRVIPAELCELPVLKGFADTEALEGLAERFEQRDFEAGEVIVEAGQPVDTLFLLAHGRLRRQGQGKYGEVAELGVLADGDYFGAEGVASPGKTWDFSVKATTPGTLLALSVAAYEAFAGRCPALQVHTEAFRQAPVAATNYKGEAEIAMAAGHVGEVALPGTFVDYDVAPREYELSVAQTVLRVHSRVADLYNNPMNQTEQQLRLAVEALKERQEHELINNREFGLLHNADNTQRIQPHSGPPTPDDLDDLITRRRSTHLLLAHPRTIAAFGRECNHLGLYPDSVQIQGHTMPSWRGIPLLPCNKIPISTARTSSILAMRLGEEEQGVVGLHQTGIPDEYEPSLSVRFMGIDEKAIISYLVSRYYSAAVLVPDALGVLENVQISRWER